VAQAKGYRRLVLILASAGGLGYLPVAPGTWGSLAGVVLSLGLLQAPEWLYFLTLLAFFFVASWLAGQVESLLQKRDPQLVVVDEVVGYLVSLATFPPQWHYLVAGFVLFRIFDIVKPFPASFFNRRAQSGYDVVLDDVCAGVYANLCLQAARLALGALR
jgi:phosphatidylglycerophosphatase A